MIAITGASGQLGRFAMKELLSNVEPGNIVAAVRNPEKVQDLKEQGVVVRYADYSKPESLEPAFQSVDKLLLISGSEVGQRVPQHKAVIEAATKAGVQFIAYTSILRADSSPIGLAKEHRETEAAIRDSGMTYALLRNGWYTENYTAGIPAALEHGVLIGSAGDGRIASAARKDYAAAAAAVLLNDAKESQIYELAGDSSFTVSELAAEVAQMTGKPFEYKNLPQEDYKAALIQVGLPEAIAAMLADSSFAASKGALFDDSKQLSQLIGRSTTPLTEMIKAALNQ